MTRLKILCMNTTETTKAELKESNLISLENGANKS